jgi:adenylate cyclase
VDKYLGDGLLALFEAEDPARSASAALQAVHNIGHALDLFNETLQAEGQRPVAIGIGAHLGTVVLGEIGAAGRAPRTLIGDTVNTASRLEGATKEHQVQALLSEPLLKAANASYKHEELIPLELRGLTKPLTVLPVANVSGLSRIVHWGESQSR